jgi:hypothetical protein
MLNNLGSMLLCTTNDEDLDFFGMQPIYMFGGCLGNRDIFLWFALFANAITFVPHYR